MNRLQQIALTKVKGVGAKTLRALLSYCRTPEEVFSASRTQLAAIPNIRAAVVDAILSKESFKEAEKELAMVEKLGIKVLWTTDKEFPTRLNDCEDAPLLLYAKGHADLNPRYAVSIVGSRNASSYGLQICEELIASLSSMAKLQIISGLAYGIDIQAHRLALKHNIPTVAVLGHGFESLYPAAHREVATRMLEMGGLLTEFDYSNKPVRMNFPARNRIIAGLSDVTIVVEAAKKGGALITAEIANSYNRDVCAYPGSINQVYSEGCNYLIKTNRAHLIRNAADLCYLMGWEQLPEKNMAKQLNLLETACTKDELIIKQYLKLNPKARIDAMAQQLDWPISKLSILLLELEIKEQIIALPGKTYKNL